jgi:hypothetical protein
MTTARLLRLPGFSTERIGHSPCRPVDMDRARKFPVDAPLSGAERFESAALTLLAARALCLNKRARAR